MSEIEDTINITIKEYKELLDSRLLLSALEHVRVYNWHGYSDAIEQYQEWSDANE